jgi:transcription termination factor NusB
MNRALLMAAVLALAASTLPAGEIGFDEEYALAKDRSVPLKQLIPGTEEYYFYQCLYYETSGQLDKVDETLKLWIERYGQSARVDEIRNRQALLTYDKDPAKSLAYLVKALGLQFNHQRERLDQKSGLATALDPSSVSRETLKGYALGHYENLQGFEDAALDWLAAEKLTGLRLRDFLNRLRRSDYENLPQLVVDDLNYEHSAGFGAMEIHRLLLRAQLDECLKLKPDLLNDTRFVRIYISKLRPGFDVNLPQDVKERQAYLDRLWDFVKQLAPAHNTLKAGVLYQRLVLDREQGVYDKDRFMEYVKLPRSMSYMEPKYLESRENRDHLVDLNAGFEKEALLRPIGSDEELVRSYLLQFFSEAESIKPFDTYIRDDYLKRVFAETKIVNGLGDKEKWFPMLSPQEYQALKERIDIDFAWTNKRLFAPEEAVGLDVYVKNVKTLIVRVFEINALNYYRTNLRQVDTSVNLDGLVANEELDPKATTYSDAPLLRVKRHFDFPALKKRGVYIVELIGNGKSSRALIQKGQFRFLSRTSSAGDVFTILNESNQMVKDGRLWLGGHVYEPDAAGRILVPFTNTPGTEPIVLSQGEAASLASFDHAAEAYTLAAGIYVDRESLLKRKTAEVLLRPVLYLNGTPVTLTLLEEPLLTITSTDLEGVSTTKEVRDFKLFEDRESTYEFRVPERLAKIVFTLTAKVKNLSQNKKVDLSAGRDFTLNGIDATEKVEDLFLGHIDGKYVLDLLGKTGEPKADRPVNFNLKHRDFRDAVHAALQTDAQGRIALGELKDIVSVAASGPEGTTHTWFLASDQHSYPATIQGQAGEKLTVPYMGKADKPLRSELSLLELRDAGMFVADRFSSLQIKGGMILIEGLPAGDYDLLLKESNTRIRIRLTQGEVNEGYALGNYRHLEIRNPKPLQIVAVEVDDKEVRIRLDNSSKFARVHLLATRYLPAYMAAWLTMPGARWAFADKPASVYVAGREIGDEYRYIIDRKYAMKFPGNMLDRPGLLLNPWSLTKTETSRQEAAAGGRGFATGRGGGGGGGSEFFGVEGQGQLTADTASANFDFLSNQSVVMANLAPDDKGLVTLKRADLGDHQQIRVLAVDPENMVYREVSLPEIKAKFQDLRLQLALDPTQHFTEQKEITFIDKGKEFVLPDITTASFEAYDSVAKLYTLYLTLSNNPTLAEFKFLLDWPKLKDAEKREKYSKYACHELNFFLLRRDPEFFKKVVQPYLKNKKDKTYLDHWLIEDDLSPFLKPWSFSQLNIVERALLGQRVKAEEAAMARHIKELCDLLPPDIERYNYLFKTALKAGSLETADRFKLGAATDRAENRKLAEMQLKRAAGPSGGNVDGYAAAAGLAPAPAEARPAPMTAAMPAKPAPARRMEAAKKAASESDQLSLSSLEESERDASKDRAAALQDKAAGESLRRLGDGKGEAAEKELTYYGNDAPQREQARQFYRKLEKTEELAENNYYHLLIAQQTADLVTVNAFWRDFAARGNQGPFFSTNMAEASRGLSEMLLALAVVDLPFEPGEHKTEYAGPKMTLQAGSPMIVYHKEIKPSVPLAEKTPILVSQNFFRVGDQYRFVDSERIEKYVTEEFLTSVAYGCHVVITNPTSLRQKLDVLLQVPRGSMPLANGQYTRSLHLDLEPYNTRTLDYFFYFPSLGEYPHYPVQVAKNEKLIAWAEPVTLKVVEKLSKIDTASWDYVSQNEYLKQNNLNRLNLERIAWRVQDQDYFAKVLELLQGRHVYNPTLWSYGLKHNVVAAIREYLQHSNGFVGQCGAYINTPLLTIDPLARKAYQHLEYSPLVNARAHKLGKKLEIVNDRLFEQYKSLMRILSYRDQLDDDDLMAVTYYLLLQDRVEEAQPFFKQVNPQKLSEQLQYDYFTAYVDFYNDSPKAARGLAKKYEDYPVDRWRKLFANVASQLDEIEGQGPKVADTENRTQVQSKLAETEAGFDLKVEARKITVEYQNLAECTVNYYLMDIELMFSRQPFVQEFSGQFSFIRPNLTELVKLPAKAKSQTFDLPKQFHSSNVLVEIVAGGVRKSKAYYANSLSIQLVENYGQLKVADEKTGKALPKVYVKVYARTKDGQVKFYKDGYTDLRGRFDYTSLSTNEIDFVEKFALLILSESEGAVVREVSPPKQ